MEPRSGVDVMPCSHSRFCGSCADTVAAMKFISHAVKKGWNGCFSVLKCTEKIITVYVFNYRIYALFSSLCTND